LRFGPKKKKIYDKKEPTLRCTMNRFIFYYCLPLLLVMQPRHVNAAGIEASYLLRNVLGSRSAETDFGKPIRRVQEEGDDAFVDPDCYEVDWTHASSPPLPSDPDRCGGISQTLRYYKDLVTYVIVHVDVKACGNAEANECSMKVNNTDCECTYNFDANTGSSITMTDHCPAVPGVFPEEGEPQTISVNGNLQESFKLASCSPPDPWMLFQASSSSPMPPERNEEGMCHTVFFGSYGTSEWSNACRDWKTSISFFNHPYESADTPGKTYATATLSGTYGCYGDENDSHCSVEVSIPLAYDLNNDSVLETETQETRKCKTCIPDAESPERIGYLDCSNLPGRVNLTVSSSGALELEDTDEMCNHPSAVAAKEFYSYCGEKLSFGRVVKDKDTLEQQCYAADKGECSYSEQNWWDGCTKLSRAYEYYNKINSTAFDAYGKVLITLAYDCSKVQDDKCLVSVDGVACDACENSAETISMMDCTNLPEDSLIQLSDQTLNVFYESPKITSPDDICSHPAVVAQSNCINGSAISGLWPELSHGQLVEGECYALDTVTVDAVDCDKCHKTTTSLEYYNEYDGVRDIYGKVTVSMFEDCYVGSECTVTVGDHPCDVCVVGDDGKVARINCSSVPDDAIKGTISLSQEGSIKYTGTKDICEHPSVVNQTSTQRLRSGSTQKKNPAKESDTTLHVIPSSLHFFFHDSLGGDVGLETTTALMSSTLDFLALQPTFRTVSVDDITTVYREDSPTELTVSFQTRVVLDASLSSTKKETAVLVANADWNHYISKYAKMEDLPSAKKVVFRAVLSNSDKR